MIGLKRMSKFSGLSILFSSFIAFAGFSSIGLAIEKPGEQLKAAGLTTRLGAQIDTSLPFTSFKGLTQPLKDFALDGRPTVLIPVYYRCPRLCGLVLSSVTKMLNDLPLILGKDFRVVTVSFDSSESPEAAARIAQKFHSQFKDPVAADDGWQFLVGNKENVDSLMNQIGFKYVSDQGEFAHSAAIMILTPNGRISQYFTDINFSSWDVRLALVEASQGRIGTALDHFLLFCFRFDEMQGKYTWAAWNFVRVGVILSALACLYFVYRSARSTTGSVQNLP